MNKRTIFIVGNWKMYKTVEESLTFLHDLLPQLPSLLQDKSLKVGLAVPFTSIQSMAEAAKESMLQIGAQNMHDASSGAFTGEIAARMLKEVGATFVILGHSERRKIFLEDNATIGRKLERALEEGLQPILCIGESLEEREKGNTEKIVAEQLEGALSSLKEEDLSSLVLAYEPIWAIGTGETATPEQAQEVHLFCRNWIRDKYSANLAEQMIIQYGGSVKPGNVADLLRQPDIDGLLIGGGSLEATNFAKVLEQVPSPQIQEQTQEALK